MKYVIEYSLDYFFSKTDPIEANSLDELMDLFRKSLKKIGIESELALDTINIQTLDGCGFCRKEYIDVQSNIFALSIENKNCLQIELLLPETDIVDNIKIIYCPFCGRKL